MTDDRNPVGQQPNSSLLFAIKLLGTRSLRNRVARTMAQGGSRIAKTRLRCEERG
jgi:hypothetical protein